MAAIGFALIDLFNRSDRFSVIGVVYLKQRKNTGIAASLIPVVEEIPEDK